MHASLNVIADRLVAARMQTVHAQLYPVITRVYASRDTTVPAFSIRVNVSSFARSRDAERISADNFRSISVCPNSTYWQTWNLCKPCPDINHIILDTPATNSSFCVCKTGFKANAQNRCEILQCPQLEPPENGYFVKHPNGCTNVLNAACGARCKSGYQLSGSSIRLCQEDGTWSGTEAKCACMKLPRLFCRDGISVSQSFSQ